MAAKNSWKLPFEELLPKISLLKPEDSTRSKIEGRLILLSQFRFVKLTMTEDEEHIVDVEIPVTKPASTVQNTEI
jgi:hypothetical protein